MSIKVKRLQFRELPTIAVYMNEYTEEVKVKVLRMQRYDQVLRDKSAANYCSAVTHEICNPLNTVIFFLKQIIAILSLTVIPTNKL